MPSKNPDLPPPRFKCGDQVMLLSSRYSDFKYANEITITSEAQRCVLKNCSEGDHWIYESGMHCFSENILFRDEADFILRRVIREAPEVQ